jgi:hypothetical protein
MIRIELDIRDEDDLLELLNILLEIKDVVRRPN